MESRTQFKTVKITSNIFAVHIKSPSSQNQSTFADLADQAMQFYIRPIGIHDLGLELKPVEQILSNDAENI